MKNLNKADVAVIGGSSLESLLKKAEPIRIGTSYGLPSQIFIGKITEKKVAFLPRHNLEHTVPPHRINYRANISALHLLGVERILATNAVGSINKRLKPGDLTVAHDFIDFTKLRKGTFYDDAPVTHVDMSQPYCPELREVLIRTIKQVGENVWNEAVLACTEGPRYETPAEIEMLKRLGCDIVGMTALPEAVLARELEMCYVSLCYVSNMAVGLQKRQTVNELTEIANKKKPIIEQILKEAISSLPKTRKCSCKRALKDARL
ncbi:MAG: S-methyl-5'-thioinosine phosphorylase [Candidatus Bathyarchaeia archaeon]